VAGEAERGEPPRNLGTITLNPDGSVRDVTLGEPMDLRGEERSGQVGSETVAALPETDDPEELYGNAYEFVLSGDYGTAEAGFRRHIERFPDDPKTADARYWLGESLLAQQRHAEAAEVFLAASRDFPDARKAPDMLLKLGITLSAMGQRDVACATFREVGARYPGASAALRDRVRQEATLAGC
jgi:tol-pal system protein YbgF